MAAMAGHEQGRGAPEAADGQVQLALVAVASAGAVFAMGALVGWGARTAASTAVGAVIAVANLWVMKRIVRAFLGQSGSGRAIWGLVGAVKFTLLLGGVWMLLSRRLLDPLPLAVGYGALPVGIALAGWLGGRNLDDT
jgi:hypothetical protein